jgi:isoleucyl-tRNA synthetase
MADSPYPKVDAQPDFPAMERDVLAFWRRERIFEASVEQRPAGPDGSHEFVFYDGPPFANGLPHYGHLLTGYVKDVVPRYQTLRGRRVERRFGWDCHGLPAEMEAERELGISGRASIEAYGIGKFNDYCRSSVMRYTEAWVEYVTRQARWVDFSRDYKSMDGTYMESVLWAFKSLWDRGLVYEGKKVVAYSWAAQTPVANFETRLDNAYRDRQDPAITVRLPLLPGGGVAAIDGSMPTEIWIWTTTPWTLPSNLAVAVGPEIPYAVLERDGRRIVLGQAARRRYEAELAGATDVATVLGRELEGRRYTPLFPFFAERDAFRVLAGDFVKTDEGTGIVHMAPGFGEDDMDACERAGIELVCPVDDAGCFTSDVPPYAGRNVLDANPDIIRALRDRGVLVRHDSYVHSYPHCWRTDTPLIYKAVSSWFVRVTDFRDRMVELNQQIRWIPEHIRDGSFGNWLANARDWAISRNRFWGAPIPVWKSDDPAYPRIDVYGSLDELERDFGVRPTDLHRPMIDELTRPNPDDPTGKSKMVRVPEVLDCWFESGSMPYAQVHYPFESREWFESHFPADFITEYIAQTRGWFYTLMVLSTALFDRPPFRTCICHGVVLDEKGQKLSKRLRNYPDPVEVFETYGADAMRWFLSSSPILRGADLQIDREGQRIREVVRLILIPIWNAYYFFTLYANSENVRAVRVDPSRGGASPTEGDAALDRYILAKTRGLVVSVGASMDDYDLAGACGAITSYIDVLNNWYIRRSRDRFYAHGEDRDPSAYDTLYTALVTLTQVASPLLPLLCETLYRGLTGERSVHLGDWPNVDAWPEERELVDAMDRVREVCSAALALRRAHQIRVRQPLRTLTVAGPWAPSLAPYRDLICDEVNVKELRLETEVETYASFRLKVDARAVGPRLGKKMQTVLEAAREGDWQAAPGGVMVAGERLGPTEHTIELTPKEGVHCQALSGNDALVTLDPTLDPALEAEGRARDLVRAVQQARRDAGLQVSDRIHLVLAVPPEWQAAATEHRAYIAGETLATELLIGAVPSGTGFSTHDAKLGDETIRVALRKAASG